MSGNCGCVKELIVEIKYHNDSMAKLEKIAVGDWIDLRASESVTLEKGELKLISLGVSMKLPEGYEAHIVPRSSTASKFGVLQANHIGIVDNSYSGTNDIWKFSAYAIRDTTINLNDRICQFRLFKTQQRVYFDEVESLDSTDRGGFGSTGTN